MIKNSLKNCKNQLRQKYKTIRDSIADTQRTDYNQKIFNTVINSDIFKKADTIYAYASIGSEVETYRIIDYALKQRKKVALPYCIPNTALMDFYYISSVNHLKKGAFGVPEPDPNCNPKAENKNSLIFVPALAFDKNGMRMGYGKGYYDRFLTDFTGIKIGLCYSKCISRCILHNHFDRCVDYIITDNFTKFIAK